MEDTGDWRAPLQPESRQRVVNKIMDTLKTHLPISSQEALHEHEKIAQRFEEKIFKSAISQSDYIRKISLKMLMLETKSQVRMEPLKEKDTKSYLKKAPMDSIDELKIAAEQKDAEIEELKLEVRMGLLKGFARAKEQVELLYPDVDLSQISVYKVIFDGKLVEMPSSSEDESDASMEETGGVGDVQKD